MQADGWQDRLHLSFLGEHFLFDGLRIDSFASFCGAALITVVFCISERMLTLALSTHWNPFRFTRKSRLRIVMWRTSLYWIVTLLRLLYMLAAMTFHLGIILVTVTTLSAGQLVIEYLDTPHPSTRLPSTRFYGVRTSQDALYPVKEPLLHSPSCLDDQELLSYSIPLSSSQPRPEYTPSYTRSSFSSAASSTQQRQSPPKQKEKEAPTTRPRSKSKPEEIFIHPAQSNFVRAEALAIRLGLADGRSDLVDLSSCAPPLPTREQPDEEANCEWGGGKGRDIARELLLGSGAGRS